jgi:uncharacterized membrane protein YhaH (DUF805 family)
LRPLTCYASVPAFAGDFEGRMNFLRGRLNRATYWLVLGLILLAAAVLEIVFHQRTMLIEGLLVVVCVPRLQDIGRPGWWAFGPFLFAVLGTIAGIELLPLRAFMALNLCIDLVIGALLMWLGALPGQAQANAYGEPPVPGVAFKRRSKPG